jgi:hypothetical protein
VWERNTNAFLKDIPSESMPPGDHGKKANRDRMLAHMPIIYLAQCKGKRKVRSETKLKTNRDM